MEQRKAVDLQASSLMVMLCMIWGIQQVVLKWAADDISPMMQIALRSGLAALLVLPFLKLTHPKDFFAKSYLLPGMWLAFLFSAEYLLVAEALRYTSASHVAVLLYTAPVFVALGMHWKFPTERLSRLQWSGILLAFTGIAFAFLGRESAPQNKMMLYGDALALIAGFTWALTTISLRMSRLGEAPPTQTLLYQLVGCFILLTPVAYLTGQAEIHWTPVAIGSMVFHVVIMSFISLMLWFWLLRHYLANGLGVFSFLTPLFGMFFGVVLLKEQIEPQFVVGAVLVLIGVMTVSLHQQVYRSYRRVFGR